MALRVGYWESRTPQSDENNLNLLPCFVRSRGNFASFTKVVCNATPALTSHEKSFSRRSYVAFCPTDIMVKRLFSLASCPGMLSKMARTGILRFPVYFTIS